MSTTDRAAFTDGLIAVARFLHDHPEVPLPYLGPYAEGSSLPCLPIYLHTGDQKAQLATITRAMGNATKAPASFSNGDERFQVWRAFKGIVLMAQASRDQVCTRVVTGTEDREVEEVVTPAVTRKVTKPVEVVEWRCESILAPAAVPHVRVCGNCGASSATEYLHVINADTGGEMFLCADNPACYGRRDQRHNETAKAGATS